MYQFESDYIYVNFINESIMAKKVNSKRMPLPKVKSIKPSKAPQLTRKAMEESLLEVGNVKENFPKIEKLLFKLTGIAPAENTVDARLRCAFTSANAKSLTKVTPSNMKSLKALIEAKFNLVMCYPMDLLAEHVDAISDEEFKEAFTSKFEDNIEGMIQLHTINSVEAIRAYGRFNRVGKKWPDYYDAEYTICGMADELVEFSQATEEEKSHELGDVLWYLMSVCEFWDASDEDIAMMVEAGKKADADKNATYDYTKAFHKFVKLMRDEPYLIGDFSVIAPMMADVYCTCIKYAGGIDALSNVALENVAKIRDRIERGVVRGSGDNR